MAPVPSLCADWAQLGTSVALGTEDAGLWAPGFYVSGAGLLRANEGPWSPTCSPSPDGISRPGYS